MQFIPYFFILLTVILLVWQFYPLIKIKLSKGKHTPSLNKFLSADQQKHPRILLYFMSPQCGLCKSITPIVDELAMKRSDIIRFDLTQNMTVAEALGVRATPAFVLIQDGVILKVKLGALTKDKILAMIDQ